MANTAKNKIGEYRVLIHLFNTFQVLLFIFAVSLTLFSQRAETRSKFKLMLIHF